MEISRSTIKVVKSERKKVSLITGIIPFTEQPSSRQYDDHENITQEMRASDLFSLFTADIIKEEIIFVR